MNTRVLNLLPLLVLITCFFFFTWASPVADSSLGACLNLDSLLYVQYAQAWADGHPYCFNAQDAPTTGSTSHLYPLFVSILCRAGLEGAVLVAVLFWIHALLLVLFIRLFGAVVYRIEPRATLPVILLLLFSGQTYLTFLGLSDMGLFCVMMALVWYGALSGKRILLAATLFLLPLVRPEGVIVVVGLFLVAGARTFLISGIAEKEKCLQPALWAGGTGVLLLFALNILITGHAAFDSVLHRNLFSVLSPLEAIVRSAENLRELVWIFIAGKTPAHQYPYLLPVLGALLVLPGLARIPWRDRTKAKGWVQCWWLLSAAGVMAMLATSPSPHIHQDRYLTWIFPLIFFYVVYGALSLRKPLRTLVILAVVAYQLMCLPYFIKTYLLGVSHTAAKTRLIRRWKDALPAGAEVLCRGGAGIKYLLGDQRILNIDGFVSPQFREDRNVFEAVERLRNEPGLQAAYWALWPESVETIPSTLLGERMEPGLFKADWSWMPTNSWMPLHKDLQEKLKPATAITRIDVGYTDEEYNHGFSEQKTDPNRTFFPLMTTGSVAGVSFMECGRVVSDGVQFTIPVSTGQPLTIVIRMLINAKVHAKTFGQDLVREWALSDPCELTVETDTGFLRTFTFPRDHENQTIQENVLTIPADAVAQTPLTITVWGGHFPLCYWFYQ